MNTPETTDLIEVLRNSGTVEWREAKAIDWKAVIEELGDGPVAGNVFQAAVEFPDLASAKAAIHTLVLGLTDPGAAQEIVAVLCAGLAVPVAILEPLFEDFQQISFKSDAHFGVRAAALKGALYLSQGRTAWQYLLQSKLLEIDVDDDPIFLRHAANVVSIFAAQRPDPPFLDLLRDLASIPEASDEAAVGLGGVLLAQALGTATKSEAVALFSEAASWFDQASSTSEERADAKLFSEAIHILLNFGKLGDLEMANSVEAIKAHLQEHLAVVLNDDGRPEDKSWIGLKTTELAHWANLSVKLAELTSSFKLDNWIDAIRVIEEQLFHVLTASKTIFSRSKGGGVEAVAGPLIRTDFLARKSHLAMLDQWLSQKQQSVWWGEAASFRASLRSELSATVLRSPFDAADAPSSFAALKGLEGLSSYDVAEIDAMSDAAQRKFSFQATDPLANDVLRRMLADLRGNADFARYEDARDLFITVLEATIKFVVHCDNVQSNPMTEYLFRPASVGDPLEKDIQQHYWSALDQSNLSRVATLEPQNVGGGRADVRFGLGGHLLVTECKRIFVNRTNKQVLQSFGGQVSGYQISSVSFSAVLVLDLYDRAGGAQNFRDRISIETANPYGDREFSVAVFRVQGRRKTPHDLRLSSMQKTGGPPA